MAGPSPDFNTVTLVWAGLTLSGDPVEGSLELTYSSNVPLLDDDATLPVGIYPVKIVRPLSTATITVDGQSKTVGYASFDVPATNDPDITGSGSYTLVERLTNATGQTRSFVADVAAPGGKIYLNRVTSSTPIPGEPVPALSIAQFSALDARVTSLEAAGLGGDAVLLTGAQTIGGVKTFTAPPVVPDNSFTAAKISDLSEAVQDAVGVLLQGASGVTVTYNDAGNTLTISGGGAGSSDPESVRDTIGAALIGVGAISIAVNDALDTITISTTATVNSTDAQLRDRSTHTGSQPMSTVSGLEAELAQIPRFVIASTGSEIRPEATVVLWLVTDAGLTLTHKLEGDPVLVVGGSNAPFAGRWLLFGDSLIEGYNYVTSFDNTVGQRVVQAGAPVGSYWIPPTTVTGVQFEVSNFDYTSLQADSSGMPYSTYVNAGSNIQWPLTGDPERVRVWVRRKSSAGDTYIRDVTVTTANGGSVSRTDTSANWNGLDHVDVDNPGAWVRVTCTEKAIVVGCEVIPVVGETHGMYAMGISGATSADMAAAVNASTINSLIQQVGFDGFLIAIMDNDTNLSTFTTNLQTTVSRLHTNNPGTPVIGLLLPDIQGIDRSGYRAAMVANCDGTIDCTSFPLNGTNVGADNDHWTNAGAQAFADILRAGLSQIETGGGTPASPEHSIWGATTYPGITSAPTYKEAGARVANSFVAKTGAAGWRLIGARFATPASTNILSSGTFRVWTTTTPQGQTPVREVTMTGITQGSWTEVRFAPLTLAADQKFWVGYEFTDGGFFDIAEMPSGEQMALDGAPIALASIAAGRGWFYNNAAGEQAVSWPFGIDIIVDEG